MTNPTQTPTLFGDISEKHSNSQADTECDTKQSQQNEIEQCKSDEAEVGRGTRLEVKRLDKVRSEKLQWELKDTLPSEDDDEREMTPTSKSRYDDYDDYAFIVRRKVFPSPDISKPPTYDTKIYIWSEPLRSALKQVLKYVRAISWKKEPLKLDPEILVAFLPHLKEYLETLNGDSQDTEHLALMVDFLQSEYAYTLHKIEKLLSEQEITSKLLWAIFLPMTTVLTRCEITSEKRAFRLRYIRFESSRSAPYWKLKCQYIEASDSDSEQTFGWKDLDLVIPSFEGRRKITALAVYPIEYDPQRQDTENYLLNRGRKWSRIPKLYHAHHNGLAYKGYRRYNVNGRIMVDRATYSSSYENVPKAEQGFPISSSDSGSNTQLMDSDLIFASPILYGFDLTDKHWLRFNVQNVSDIVWNDDIFKNLAIEDSRKKLLQQLIEVHATDRPFDDFVEGKGLGLIINLFGPPGVGKSLTVEAASEHLRRPLYFIEGGDLGTDAGNVDRELKSILGLVPKWNAILLIDEADVFLEKRGNHDLKRNAIVAVFLRKLEYFRGILFLTTNRAKEFDLAFQSRIHLSLHYKDLNPETRTMIWKALYEKARDQESDEISEEELKALAKRELNGRQIRNVVKLASSVARSEKMPLAYRHCEDILTLTCNPINSERTEQGYKIGFVNSATANRVFGVIRLLPLIVFWFFSTA